jgi:hypothetical protein
MNKDEMTAATSSPRVLNKDEQSERKKELAKFKNSKLKNDVVIEISSKMK